MNNIESFINKHYNILVATLFLIIIIFIMLYVYMFYPYTMDDSYISFRYATNLANGYGLVFNANELPRSEGITSPLYALVLSFGVGTFNLFVYSKFIGLLSVILSLITMINISKIFYREYNIFSKKTIKFLSIIPVLIYISDPYVIANAISGMETALGTLLFLLFIYGYLRVLLDTKETNSKAIILGCLAFLVPLVRPELTLAIISIFSLSIIFLPTELKKRLLYSILVFIICGLIYFIWRYNYFELFLPLPFYIKQESTAIPGLSNVIGFISHYILLVLLFVGSFIFTIRNKSKNHVKIFLIILAVLVIQIIYYLFIKHIMGFGFRYFQPIFPMTILVGVFLLPFLLNNKKAITNVRNIIIMLFVLSILLVNIISSKKAFNTFITWYTPGWYDSEIEYSNITRVFSSLEKKYSIALNDCGELPYYTMWKTIDLAGLNNRNIALGNSSKSSIKELKKSNVDLVILVAKSEHGKLFGWEKLEKDDLVKLGYLYLGNITINKNYHWLLFGKKDHEYDALLKPLLDNNLITIKSAK